MSRYPKEKGGEFFNSGWIESLLYSNYVWGKEDQMESTMTWKEFKERVDRKIKELGMEEDVILGYIDVSCWLMTGDDPGVFWNDELKELDIV